MLRSLGPACGQRQPNITWCAPSACDIPSPNPHCELLQYALLGHTLRGRWSSQRPTLRSDLKVIAGEVDFHVGKCTNFVRQRSRPVHGVHLGAKMALALLWPDTIPCELHVPPGLLLRVPPHFRSLPRGLCRPPIAVIHGLFLEIEDPFEGRSGDKSHPATTTPNLRIRLIHLWLGDRHSGGRPTRPQPRQSTIARVFDAHRICPSRSNSRLRPLGQHHSSGGQCAPAAGLSGTASPRQSRWYTSRHGWPSLFHPVQRATRFSPSKPTAHIAHTLSCRTGWRQSVSESLIRGVGPSEKLDWPVDELITPRDFMRSSSRRCCTVRAHGPHKTALTVLNRYG
eukprot:scaffold222458_cov31-Tisochrysis_lutea.AAC.1